LRSKLTNNTSGTVGRKKPDQSDLKNQEKVSGSQIKPIKISKSKLIGYIDDLVGVVLISIGLMTLGGIIIPSLAGGMLTTWVDFLRQFLGWGVLWIVFAFVVIGLWFISRRHNFEKTGLTPIPGRDIQTITHSHTKPKIQWGKIFALEIAAFSSLALLAVLGGLSVTRAEAGMDGGVVGWGLANLVTKIFMPLGLIGIAWVYLLLGILFIWGVLAGTGLWRSWVTAINQSRNTQSTSLPPDDEQKLVIDQRPIPAFEEQKQNTKAPRQQYIPPEFRKKLPLEMHEEKFDLGSYQRDENLPPLDLLVLDQASRPDEKSINQTAGLIEKTLAEFGIPATVLGYRTGPTVTQFAVEPGFVEKEKGNANGENAKQKVRVSQIASLQRDLALALAAERLRIEAPVPGRPYVGIEVPNTRTMAVRLRAVLESKDFIQVNTPLAIALGRDVSGQPVVADLTTMPHLLIAGTTGSGKSVCIAAIAICLVMNNTPENLRLVMIDPKMVELQRFKGLPHLLGDVETKIERIAGVLRWVVVEMERRYRLLDSTRSRNIDSYNKKLVRRNAERLPRIVVMIDELSDLMMSAPDQTEHNLVRLAQMARAVGIHLIIATQRPSVEVVTGLIKANFPARIAFNVTSSIDSRVILDTVGAENLLGRGDMLFLPPEASSPVRSQGVIVTDLEIQKVIAYWIKHKGSVENKDKAPWDQLLEEESVFSDRDELIEKAIKLLRGSDRASTSMLQRKLRIGFPRAARLMEELEELGIVGPAQPGFRDREVLLRDE
jgi:DNA segregation ATPase FtsK/SpoIIIE, S-DNA-T family